MTITKIDLGVEYLGGFTRPSREDCLAGRIATAGLDSLNDPTIIYEDQTAAVADDTFASTLAQFLRGAGLTVDSSGNLSPTPRPRYLRESDSFVSGGVTSGTIGKLGWSLLGSGTPAFAREDNTAANDTKRVALTTSGSLNDRTVLCLGDTETRLISVPSRVKLIQFASNFASVTAAKRIFLGLSANLGTEPSAAVNCLGIYSDAAVVSGRWQVIARAGSVGSPVDTAVAPSSSATELLSLYQPTAGTWQFYIGNTLVGTVTTNIPTGGLNVGVRLETLAGATKTHRLGGFTIVEDLLGSALDDDAFLEV